MKLQYLSNGLMSNVSHRRRHFSDVRSRAWFGFYSGSVGIVNRLTTAAAIGRKVSGKDNAIISFP
jgi:hypothetical protein